MLSCKTKKRTCWGMVTIMRKYSHFGNHRIMKESRFIFGIKYSDRTKQINIPLGMRLGIFQSGERG